jgi:hypothetical protein
MKIALNTLVGLNRKQLQHYLGWAKRCKLTNINLNSKTVDLTTEWERIATVQGELILVGYWVESSKGDQLFMIEWTEQKAKAEEVEEKTQPTAEPEATTTEANPYDGLEGKYYVPTIYDGQNLEIFQDKFGGKCLGSISEIKPNTELWLCDTPGCAVTRANDIAYWYKPDKVTGFKPHGTCIEVEVQDGKLVEIKEASGKITVL